MIVPARRNHPRSVNYRRSGLGTFNPPAVPNYETCDPRDTDCVMRNGAKSDAYDLAMAGAQAQNNYDQCMANAANAKSQEQYDSVVANCKAAYSGAASQAAQTAATPVTWTNPVPVSSAPVFTATPVPSVPVVNATASSPGATVVTSSGAQAAPSTQLAIATDTGSTFSLSSIPWWAWAAGAGVALFAFGGRR